MNELYRVPDLACSIIESWDFPGGSVVKKPPAMQEMRVDPWVKKIPQRRKQQPALVFLPGKSHGHKNLVGYSPWDCNEMDMT